KPEFAEDKKALARLAPDCRFAGSSKVKSEH
ncbi:unnamed protein product, partial [marine sediment metagenome]